MSLLNRRMTQAFLLLFLAAFLPFANSSSAEDQIFYAEAAEWVERIPFVETDQPEGVEGGFLLLFDQQTNDVEESTYVHVVGKYLTQGAIQENGKVVLEFDPSYQTLTIHTLSIYRDGESIDQLPTCRRKLVQSDTLAKYFVHTNEHTLLFFLDDLREGDILEMSYTKDGKFPSFKDQIQQEYFLALGLHVQNLSYRLIADKEAPLNVKVHQDEVGGKIEPMIQEVGEDFLEWRWQLCDVEPVKHEPYQPCWLLQDSWIQVSSYRSWNEFAKSVLPLFSYTDEFSDELFDLVEGWKEEFPTVDRQVLEAIRFVQDKIRYLSLDDGGMGCIPHHPNDVFTRRYGDCKDKTNLLVAICEMLGVKAYPALVNAFVGKLVKEVIPANFFNHAICCIEYRGNKHFVDPTSRSQGGTLETITCPPYFSALILSEETEDLTEIPLSRFQGKAVKSYEYTIHPAKETAEMSLHVDLEGISADSARRELLDLGIDAFAKGGKEKYQKFYEEAEFIQPPQAEDDREDNRISIQYDYNLEGVGEFDEKSGSFSCKLYPLSFDGFITTNFPPSRNVPLQIPYPLEIEESILVTLDPYFLA